MAGQLLRGIDIGAQGTKVHHSNELLRSIGRLGGTRSFSIVWNEL